MKSPMSISLIFLSAALTCGISFLAKADDGAAALPEVLLDSEAVSLPSADCRVIRTSLTPEKVDLTLPIEMSHTVCVQTAEIPTTGANGAQCGYDTYSREICRDIPGACHVIDPRTGRQACAPARRECGYETTSRARVCTYMVTQCVRTEIVTSPETRKARLKFRNLAPLATGETETYELHATQKRLDGSRTIFDVRAITTKEPVKIKSRDGLFTLFKEIITIKNK